jgi:hypothetical protein
MKQASAVRSDHVDHRAALFMARGDVEKAQLVGALRVIRHAPARQGSPASRRSTKLTPLTVRPSFTSRQGMTRTFKHGGLSA